MSRLTVIEKFTVPGEHREAFGSNKKSFNSSGYARRQHRPEPLLSGRGEPAAATAARRHHYLRSQAPTHPNQASEPRRPSFAGRKQILRRRSNINWKRGSKEKEDAAQRMNSSKKSCLKIGAWFVQRQTGHSGAKNIVAHNKGCTELKG